MMTLEELRARVAELEATLRALHEEIGENLPNEEQSTKWADMTREHGERKAQLAEAEQRLAERREMVRKIAQDDEARAKASEQTAPAPEVSRSVEPGDGATGAPKSPEVMRRVVPETRDVLSLTRSQARDMALKVLEDRNASAHMEDRQMRHMDRILRRRTRNMDGSLIARRMLLTENDAYRSAFVKCVTRTSPVLSPEEREAMERFDEFRAMSIGTDASGGFGVPVLIDPTIILTGQGSPNDILNLARVEVITNDEWKGVTSAGVSWSYDAEAAEVSDDSPTLAQPNVPTHMARGFIPYSIEVGMDYPNFAAEMSMLLSEGYAELNAEMFTTGSGSDQPTGIVTALDANTNDEVTPTTDGAFGAVDLYKLWDALPIKYRRSPNTAWMSSTDVMNEVRNFGTSIGSNFTVDLTDESIPRLFARRYHENDYMDDFTSSTGSANLLIVGEWKNFLVAQRAGMSVELIPHLFGTSANRPTGQRGWFAWARAGSDSINDLGFRILQNQ